jgi:hypothetical protein
VHQTGGNGKQVDESTAQLLQSGIEVRHLLYLGLKILDLGRFEECGYGRMNWAVRRIQSPHHYPVIHRIHL